MAEPKPTNHAPEGTLTSESPDTTTLTEILSDLSSDLLLTTPPSQAYLTHLTSLPLPALLTEPTLLQTQSHHLTSSLTSLTHTSYPTFLSLHRTTTSLSTSLDSLSSSLDSLLDTSLPALEECAAGWKERTEGVLKERKKARVVLEQHDKIRDLLDIPLLIDTCVRNGYFAEALSLASHATSLSTSTMQSPTSPATPSPPPLILTSILAEVHHSITQMLHSLLATLHEPTRKLPALWKAVNFLRKMDAFPPSDGASGEDQIALAFLGGREACLKSALEGCGRDVQGLIGAAHGGEELGEREKEDVAKFLKKYIDVWREGVYDIITQYSTIFLERSSVSSNSLPSHHPNPTSPTRADSPNPNPNPNPNPQTTLHPLLITYTTHTLTTHLLPLLKRTLPLLPPPSLPSLLTQLTYCATAFARVGMDFRGVLGGLFCSAVAGAVGRELKDAGGKWVGRVKAAQRSSGSGKAQHGSGQGQGKEKGFTPPSQWLITPALATSPPTPTPTMTAQGQGPPHLPPQILASYPPLAEYTNALLGSFNGLRLLAPVGVLEELLGVLEGCLGEGGRVLLGYAREVCASEGAGGDREQGIARAVGEVYVVVFVPFVRRALVEGVYGVKDGYGDGGGDGSELGRMVREWEGWLGGSEERDG
jgi:hypothetical protein